MYSCPNVLLQLIKKVNSCSGICSKMQFWQDPSRQETLFPSQDFISSSQSEGRSDSSLKTHYLHMLCIINSLLMPLILNLNTRAAYCALKALSL